MRELKVTVPWKEGLHARPAAKLVKMVHQFKSQVLVRFEEQTVDARSILNLLLLCATMGATISFEVCGDDEDVVIAQIQEVFDSEH